MAELQQILGNIFKDIAQARVTSDIYSRNISKYYEQDPLLRKFPLPRTEVSEVEVDLKFVMSGLDSALEQDEGLETSTAPLFIKLSKELSDGLFEHLLETSKKYANLSPETAKRLKGTEHRIYLSQSLILYFQRNRGKMVKRGKFNLRQASSDIGQVLRARADELLADSGLADKQLDDISKVVLKKLDIESQLKSVEKPMLAAHEQEAEFRVGVEVTADKLAEAPEASISSVKVKAQVRNYIWSKVEHEGETWRSLNPE
jgi:hypothetical protein